MFSEAEYVDLKGVKNRSPVEETHWQSVREERRRLLKMEAKRIKRVGYSEEKKITERERNREQRAKLTEEEAGAATKRNTDRWRLARAKAAEGKASKMLIVEVSENGEVISKRYVSVGDNEDVAPLPELVDASDEMDLLAVVRLPELVGVQLQKDHSPPLAKPRNFSVVINGADSGGVRRSDVHL